jgi:hypothetical protein
VVFFLADDNCGNFHVILFVGWFRCSLGANIHSPSRSSTDEPLTEVRRRQFSNKLTCAENLSRCNVFSRHYCRHDQLFIAVVGSPWCLLLRAELFVLAARDSVRAPTLIVGVDWNNMRHSGAFQSAIPSACGCQLIDSKVY